MNVFSKFIPKTFVNLKKGPTLGIAEPEQQIFMM